MAQMSLLQGNNPNHVPLSKENLHDKAKDLLVSKPLLVVIGDMLVAVVVDLLPLLLIQELMVEVVQ